MMKRSELHPEQLAANAMPTIDGHPIMGHLFYYLQQIQTRFQNNAPPVNLFPHTTALSGDYYVVVPCLKKFPEMAIEWQQNNRSSSGNNDIARLHSDDLNSTSSTESGQKDLSIDVSSFGMHHCW